MVPVLSEHIIPKPEQVFFLFEVLAALVEGSFLLLTLVILCCEPGMGTMAFSELT